MKKEYVFSLVALVLSVISILFSAYIFTYSNRVTESEKRTEQISIILKHTAKLEMLLLELEVSMIQQDKYDTEDEIALIYLKLINVDEHFKERAKQKLELTQQSRIENKKFLREVERKTKEHISEHQVPVNLLSDYGHELSSIDLERTKSNLNAQLATYEVMDYAYAESKKLMIEQNKRRIDLITKINEIYEDQVELKNN